jgi:hypothetical protein
MMQPPINPPLPTVWKKSHWIYCVLTQYLTICIRRHAIAVEAGNLDSAQRELATALDLIQAAQQSIHLPTPSTYSPMPADATSGYTVMPVTDALPYLPDDDITYAAIRVEVPMSAHEAVPTFAPKPFNRLFPYSWRVMWSAKAVYGLGLLVLALGLLASTWVILGQPDFLLVLAQWVWELTWRAAIAILAWCIFTVVSESVHH